MDQKLGLVVQGGDLITTNRNILYSCNYCSSYDDHLLVHKLHHLPAESVNPMFPSISWNC